MQQYHQRVQNNILPLSVGSTLPEAFEEWSFTDETFDHEEPNEVCELCDQENLRYHFTIRNALNGHTLQVGSHCILRFQLSVFEAGRKLSPADAARKLDRLTQKMRLESCIKALEALADKDGGGQGMLQNALNYYRANKFLTPKYAAVVLWRLNERRIDHSPSFFKVCLRRTKHKEDLQAMKPTMFAYVWPALTSSQRQIAISLGIKSPT